MVEIPKANVNGQFGGSSYQIGSRFRAQHQPIVGNHVGKYIDTFIQSAIQGAAKVKEVQENSPAEKEYWIRQERAINETFAQNCKTNQADPEAFKIQAAKDKARLMKDIPQEKLEKFSLLYEDRMNGYNQAVVQNRVKLDFNRQLETFLTESDDLRTKAFNAKANGDEASYQEHLKKWLENEEYMYNYGFISAEKKVSRLKTFTDDALVQQHLGKAKTLFGNMDGLNSYLKKIEKTASYSPEQKKSIRNNIISEFNTWQAMNKVANKELTDHADFGIKAYAMGIEPKDFDFDDTLAALQANGQTEKAAQLQQAHNVRKEMISFAKLSPAQMAAELQEIKANAKSEEDLARIKALESLSQNAVKEIDGDPLAFALGHGVVADRGIRLDDANSFEERRKNAALVKEKYNLDFTPIATKAEISAISSTLKRATPEQKAALVATINNGFGEDADYIFQGVSDKNPELAVAAKVYNRNPEVSQNIILGMEIAQNEKAFVPSSNISLNNAFGKMDQALANMSTEDVAKVKSAVIANMTFKNKQNNIYGEGNAINDDKVKFADEAIEEVLGGKIVEQTGNWFWDKSYLLLPENVSEDNFKDWRDKLTKKDIGEVYIDDKPVSVETIKKDGLFAYDSDRRYTISIKGKHLRKGNGEIFVIDYEGK